MWTASGASSGQGAQSRAFRLKSTVHLYVRSNCPVFLFQVCLYFVQFQLDICIRISREWSYRRFELEIWRFKSMEFQISRSSNIGPSTLPTTDRKDPCGDSSCRSKDRKLGIVQFSVASLQIMDVFTSNIQFVGIKC